ncbi:DUF2887 domain-containing protein [Nostoc sp.]|uniref:DUF2887 domain-containing protein n=1 Tax=Nostoc sp. TaxID=1180 RepID=UPI002FF67E65
MSRGEIISQSDIYELIPHKPDFPEDTIYFVEVQFQRDDDIYWRIITEIFSFLFKTAFDTPLLHDCHQLN